MKIKLLTKPEVAEALSISTRSVDRLVSRGELKPIKILGAVRFNLEDVLRLVQGAAQ